MKINTNDIEFNKYLKISFQRTLRIPDDGKTYSLPPSMGRFPIFKVSDYLRTVPAEWLEYGGKNAVFIPMYQREAMWVYFSGSYWHPTAISMGIGKVNVITGEEWDGNTLSGDPQNYMVSPTQPWIDGIKSSENTIKQFVAMPLGLGYTVEAQVTGEEKYGGIQLVVFQPKGGLFKKPKPTIWKGIWKPYDLVDITWTDSTICCSGTANSFFDGDMISLTSTTWGSEPQLTKNNQIMYASQSVRTNGVKYYHGASLADFACVDDGAATMGLAAGGNMKQRLYPDEYGIEVWNQGRPSRIFIHICNSVMFKKITGLDAPSTPVDAAAYTRYGYPWFDLYDEYKKDLTPQDKLKSVKSINEMDKKKDKSFKIPKNQIVKYAETKGWK